MWSDDEAIEALNVCENPALRTCLYLALGCSLRLGVAALCLGCFQHKAGGSFLGHDLGKLEDDRTAVDLLQGRYATPGAVD